MKLIEDAVIVELETNKVPLITDYLERSEVLKNHGNYSDVIIYHGLDEMKRLAKVYDKKVISPIETQYSWPGMHTP